LCRLAINDGKPERNRSMNLTVEIIGLLTSIP